MAIAGVLEQQDVGRLVEAHLAGDRLAFGELVRRYQGRLQGFVARMIGDRDRAEDLVQEAFLRVHRHLHRFDRSRKFTTWVYTIASNLARNELRNRRRTPLVFFEQIRSSHADDDHRPLQFEDSSLRPDVLFANRHLREQVEAAVDRLTPHHREVFVMRELEGLSYHEIAARTGCTLGTVKSRLNRARRAFAEEIEPFVD